MTWQECKEKIDSYAIEMRHKYINEHSEYSMYEVVKRYAYENGKKLFIETLVMNGANITVDGNINGYFLHVITPTGRISKSKCYYFTDNEKEYWCNGKKYSNKIVSTGMLLNEYKKKYITIKKTKKGE